MNSCHEDLTLSDETQEKKKLPCIPGTHYFNHQIQKTYIYKDTGLISQTNATFPYHAE